MSKINERISALVNLLLPPLAGLVVYLGDTKWETLSGLGVAIVSYLWTWWKNNNITNTAIQTTQTNKNNNQKKQTEWTPEELEKIGGTNE